MHKPNAAIAWAHAGRAAVLLSLVSCLLFTGCLAYAPRITSAANAVPVGRLPPELLAGSPIGTVPIDFTLLRQQPPKQYLISPGDTLGIFVEGVLPGPDAKLASLTSTTVANIGPYPPAGLIRVPAVGVPLAVGSDGRLNLPLVGWVELSGLTLDEAALKVRNAYVVDRHIVQPGKDRTVVALFKPGVRRIIVIREDLNSSSGPSFRFRGSVPYTRRPASQVVDLPAHENDVLHALLATGGLPGVDAANQVTILRTRDGSSPVASGFASPSDVGPPNQSLPQIHSVVQIPLRLPPGVPVPFGKTDILLEEGDIVYLQSRTDRVFYTGGLLPGGEIPLPRDRDIDVMEAMAMSTGSLAGPGGAPTLGFRGASPSGTIHATRGFVIRRLPNGNQIKIHVDLNRAATDPHERIIIQPHDFVLLEYTPGEFLANFFIDFLRVSGKNPNVSASHANTAFGTNPTGGAGGSGGEGGGGGTSGSSTGN